jgi:hypothetical protein
MKRKGAFVGSNDAAKEHIPRMWLSYKLGG